MWKIDAVFNLYLVWFSHNLLRVRILGISLLPALPPTPLRPFLSVPRASHYVSTMLTRSHGSVQFDFFSPHRGKAPTYPFPELPRTAATNTPPLRR